MLQIELPLIGTTAAWRAAASSALKAGLAPEEIVWRSVSDERDLFAESRLPALAARPAGDGLRISRQALAIIEQAICHSDPQRFARAYALVYRMTRGALRWEDRTDPAMARLLQDAQTVRRAIHKMHAFVRFRELRGNPSAPRPGRRRFAAWFEPEHPIVAAAAPFFTRRFGDMDWTICTPQVSAVFLGGRLDFIETQDQTRPPEDASEELWRTYFASIFNPARLKVRAMLSEMPKRYWRNLPEAVLIPELIRGAPERAAAMAAAMPGPVPERRMEAVRKLSVSSGETSGGNMDIKQADDLETLVKQARGCTRCPLYRDATRTVFGEGPATARMMLVGEQPGDQEDLSGRPFVGPAGQLFDRALVAAGLDRTSVYVTNAVKHFKFTMRGKRRLHQRPNIGEIEQCKWWLDQELALVRPTLTVALGATACRALTGSEKGLMKRRGGLEEGRDGRPIFVTIHPSYILRLPEAIDREREFGRFRDDLAEAERTRAKIAAS
jgi:uracil-DNA glycosylase